MPVQAPTVTLAGRTITLVRPRAIFAFGLIRPAESQATDGHEVGKALGAAALRMCWPDGTPWPGMALPLAWQVGDKVERYGGMVFDDLLEAGIDWCDELLPALRTAYDYAVSSRVTGTEVREAEDFSEPPEGGQ